MGEQTFKRVTRSENLTPQQAARDEEIRRKVQQEFPPARAPSPPAQDSIIEALKRAIQQSGRPVPDISKDAGVSEKMIGEFLSGERDIRMTTADKLASVLGLKLTVG